jgi:hypothetical protein
MNNTVNSRLELRLPRVVALLLLLLSTEATVAFASPAFADSVTPRRCVDASEDAGMLQKAEKLGAARASYLVCSDAACPKDVREECVHRLSEVIDAMPSVVFNVKDASGNDLSDVRVTMDGAPLVDHVGPTAVTIDPGEHTFHFEGADPSQAIDKKFVVRDGEKNRAIDVVLGHAPVAETPAAVTPATVPPPPPAVSAEMGSSSPPPPPPEPPSSAQRTAGAWIFWGGVAGMGVGGIVGLLAKNQFNTAQMETGSQQYDDSASAVATGNAATAIVIGGAVLAVVGWIVWQTAPNNARAAIVVSRNELLLRGSF